MKTKTPKRARPRRHFTKIPFGPESDPTSLYWRVRVRDAAQNVRVNGSVSDAVLGRAGITIACHLSNCAKRNEKAFPHPCLLASFTKSTAYIVTKISRGAPREAVRYRHNLGDIVMMNDTDVTKNYIKTHRNRIERRLSLLAPGNWARAAKPTAAKAAKIKATAPRKRRPSRGPAVVPRGAMARAINAGLLPKSLASAMRDYDTELLAA